MALLPYLNNISSPMPAVSEAKTEVKKGGWGIFIPVSLRKIKSIMMKNTPRTASINKGFKNLCLLETFLSHKDCV